MLYTHVHVNMYIHVYTCMGMFTCMYYYRYMYTCMTVCGYIIYCRRSCTCDVSSMFTLVWLCLHVLFILAGCDDIFAVVSCL